MSSTFAVTCFHIAMTDPQSTASEWWSARRLGYNFALVAAGLIAFVAYVFSLEYRCANVPGVEITAFTTLFQGIGYLLAMGLANLCYQLGPGLERFVLPSARNEYRKWSYRAGLAFSIALPFAIPIMILTMGCSPGEV